MQFAPNGVTLTFEVTYYLPNLPVAISIYELAGGVQTLVFGPSPMTADVATPLTYKASYLPQPGKSYLIYKAVYTDNTFTTLDPTYVPGSETIQVGGLNLTLTEPNSNLTNPAFVGVPNVSGAMHTWLQPMVFEKITKTIENFQDVEVATLTNFRGVWQPFSAQQLFLKPEGQRAWKWFTCHAEPGLVLIPDEVINYEGEQYRVKEKLDYIKYGYVEYHLVNDFTGSGPS